MFLPFPESRGFAGKPLTTRSWPESGWSAGRFRRQEARSRLHGSNRERSERVANLRRERGEGWGHYDSLEPPRANARAS
jgi:hypothetical protein